MRASLVDEIETSGEVESARFDSHVPSADSFAGEGKDDSFLRCKEKQGIHVANNSTYAICYWVLTQLMW